MFVERDSNGIIYRSWTVRQWAGQEELPDDNVEVLTFLNPERYFPGAKAVKLVELYQACKAAIEAGFVSDALAAGTIYPSSTTDQLNIAGRVSESLVQNANASWTGTIMCKDTAGVWARRAHTHAQIRQVGLDGVAWIASQLDKLDQRHATVNAATTVTDVQAVIW